MSAEGAYKEAQRRIAEAKESGATELNLMISDLAEIPPEIGELEALQSLYLNSTQVTDLAPLQGLTELQRLFLKSTQVTDLSRFNNHTALRLLWIQGTPITDLRPLLTWPAFRKAAEEKNDPYGLWFQGSAAAEADPRLGEIAELEDEAERALKVLEHLETLPKWPEPLPWTAKASDRKEKPPSPPDPDSVPTFLFANGQLDLNLSLPTEKDQSDPFKEKMLDRLRDAVERLKRKENEVIQLPAIMPRLSAEVAKPLSEISLLDVHLEVAALTDLVTQNSDLPEPEQMDAECLTLVNNVIRFGPPLTLEDPEVERFEALNEEYRNRRLDAVRIASETRIAKFLSESAELTERARHFANLAANAADEGRMGTLRGSTVKNAILVIGGGVLGGALGDAGADLMNWAQNVLWVNKDYIMAVADTWGEQGTVWAADLMARLEQMRGEKK